MINRVVMVGRMTRDPELRRTGSGAAVTSFTLALNRNYNSADDNKLIIFHALYGIKSLKMLHNIVQKDLQQELKVDFVLDLMIMLKDNAYTLQKLFVTLFNSQKQELKEKETKVL